MLNPLEMKREDDQELWDLLGSAREPVLSPFFARNVLRDLRQEHGWRENLLRWLSPRRALPAAAAFAACVLAISAVSHNWRSQEFITVSDGSDVPEVVTKVDPRDYEIVADLDVLLAAQEDESWDDTATL